MRWGRQYTTNLKLPIDVAWNANNRNKEELLKATIPYDVEMYGTNTDDCFVELSGGIAVPRSVGNLLTRIYNERKMEGTSKYDHCETGNSRLWNGIKLGVGYALTPIVISVGVAGCTPDNIPPVIPDQSYGFYQNGEKVTSILEGDKADFRANISDNSGVKEGYVKLKSGLEIPLSSAPGSKKGENPVWQGSTDGIQLPIGNYVYELVVKDAAGNETRANGEIFVNPKDADNDGIDYRDELKYGLDPNKPNSVSKYALDNDLGIYVPKLRHLDEGGMNTDEKALVDLFRLYYPKVSQLVPSLYDEILILPELSTVETRDVEATEDILILAGTPEYKKTFESILNEGIPDKRQQCSTLQAALWKAYDIELENYGPLKNYSTENLIEDAWRNSSESMNYKSDRWKDFDEVVGRLNSTKLIRIYMNSNIKFEAEPPGENINQDALTTFNIGRGDCEDHAMFELYCLITNGDSYNNFEINQINAACILDVQWGRIGEKVADGHAVCLYKENNQYYYLDSNYDGNYNRGPFRSPEDAVKSINPEWKLYQFINKDWNITKRVTR